MGMGMNMGHGNNHHNNNHMMLGADMNGGYIELEFDQNYKDIHDLESI